MRCCVKILFLLAFLFGGLQQVAAAFNYNGVWYQLVTYNIEGNGVIVSKYGYKVVSSPNDDLYTGDIVIESSVTDPNPFLDDLKDLPCPVVAIGGAAFKNCVDLTSVSLPSSLFFILAEAFRGCENLTEITIPNSVEYIESYVFHDCNSLTKLVIPNSVEYYSADLTSCKGLTEVVFEDGEAPLDLSGTKICGENVKTLYMGRNIVKQQYGETFLALGNSGLESATIGSGVTFLPAGAFQSCKNLSEVKILGALEELGRSTFYECTALETISIPTSIKTIGQSAFNGCTNLKRINSTSDGVFHIPENVYKVSYDAFKGCTSLREVIIPASCEEIGSSVFDKISTITKVTCHAPKPPKISEYTFTNSTYSNATLVCPSPDLYRAAKGWEKFFNIISEEDDIVSVSAPRTASSQKENRAYDLNGRTIHHIDVAPKGLYIINNRVVVK